MYAVYQVLVDAGVLLFVEGLGFTLCPMKNQTRRECQMFLVSLVCGAVILGLCISVQTRYQKTCRGIMEDIEQCSDSYCLPGIAMVATDFDLNHSLDFGGVSRQRLHEYVHKVAKSWDDCKSYNPLPAKT